MFRVFNFCVMKKFRIILLSLLLLAGVVPVRAQFDSPRALGGLVKVFRATTLSDEQMAEYVRAIHTSYGSTVLRPAELPKGAN